jgi:hypothetical protein
VLSGVLQQLVGTLEARGDQLGGAAGSVDAAGAPA